MTGSQAPQNGPEPDPAPRTRAAAEDRLLALEIAGRLYPLPEEREIVVGSGEVALRLRHASIAPRHARLRMQGQALEVEALDGEVVLAAGPVRRAAVLPGQTIRLGALELGFVSLAMPGGAAPEAADGAPSSTQPAATAAVAAAAAANLDPTKLHPHGPSGQGPSFGDQVLDELRRAPWFALSIVFHAAVYLVLMLVVQPTPLPPERDRSIHLDTAEEPPPVSTEDVVVEEEVVVEELPEVELVAPEIVQEFKAETDSDDVEEFEAEPVLASGAGWLADIKNRGGDDVLMKGGERVRGGGFGTRVEKYRKTGLEIVFVFDSTGSMGSVLAATKDNIARMVEVLHALVPRSQIGIVTYRDRGPTEEYLVRQVPLGDDPYRAMNFMQTVHASGGGDRPEAVLQGLDEAFKQSWSRRARRIVVLVGDAPAHPETQRTIRQKVERFARGGNGMVHAIVTGRDPFTSRSPGDTLQSFRSITGACDGETVVYEDRDAFLKQVLGLAFGGDRFRDNIEEVYKIVDELNRRIEPWAQRIVEQRDLDEIRDQLRKRRVDSGLVRALLNSRDALLTRHLLRMLGDRSLSGAGLHAVSYVLQRSLNLPQPLIDPEREEPLTTRELNELLDVLDERIHRRGRRAQGR